VIARVGDHSLHREWLNAPGELRNWDLILSYYGDLLETVGGGDWLLMAEKGTKWPVLHGLIQKNIDLIRQYDYVWLPDDDLACSCRDINRLFEICREEDIELAQPALTHDSYFSHTLTLYSPAFRLRYTSFVEIMAPCFRTDTLLKFLSTFKENLSAGGLEYLWSALLGPAAAMAVIDEVRIRHTRRIGSGPFYQLLQAAGTSLMEDMNRLIEKHRLRRRHWTRSAIRVTGEPLPDGFRFLCLYMWGLLRAAPKMKVRRRHLPYVWLSALYQQVKGRRP